MLEHSPQYEVVSFIVKYPAPQEDIAACAKLLDAKKVFTVTDPKVVAALWVGADEAPSGDRVLRDPDDEGGRDA